MVRRSTTTTLPSGRTIELGSLTLKDYAAVREKACREYKRSLIQTYRDNLDLLPEEEREGAVQRAFKEASAITPDDMPMKMAWLPKRDKENNVVKHRGPRFYHEQAKEWIDDGEPLLEEQQIGYADWWMAFTNMGKIYATWLSMRHCPGQESLTEDDVNAMFVGEAMASLEETANVVGDLSTARLGNAEPAAAKAGSPASQVA